MTAGKNKEPIWGMGVREEAVMRKGSGIARIAQEISHGLASCIVFLLITSLVDSANAADKARKNHNI